MKISVLLLLFLSGCTALQSQPPPGPSLSPNLPGGLVAPIALYPVPLLSRIPVGSADPLEVVEAYRRLQRNPGLMKQLNRDAAWPTESGNAFLNRESDARDAVQRVRLKSKQAERLSSSGPPGAFSYVVNGKMIGGFAPIAWPAEYGVSGILTPIVNHDGVAFEKDQGAATSGQEVAPE